MKTSILVMQQTVKMPQTTVCKLIQQHGVNCICPSLGQNSAQSHQTLSVTLSNLLKDTNAWLSQTSISCPDKNEMSVLNEAPDACNPNPSHMNFRFICAYKNREGDLYKSR